MPKERTKHIVKWLEGVQDSSDGSWHEIDTKIEIGGLVRQKIVYTNQVLRALASIGFDARTPCVSRALGFLLKTQLIGSGLYDYALRFFPYHSFGRTEEAKQAADMIATEQRESGRWEWRRHHLQWFGPLFGLEILAAFDLGKYSVEIERSVDFLVKSKSNDDWDDSPSITSWALRLLKTANRLGELPKDGSKTLDWLRKKRVGGIWKLDFAPDPTSVTPEIDCDMNTTCHVIVNLSSFASTMDTVYMRDCINAPSTWVISRFNSEGSCIGKTKPDPYITALAARCLTLAETAASCAPARPRKDDGLLDKLLKKLEGSR